MSFKINTFEKVLCVLMVLVFAWSIGSFAVGCSRVRQDVLRLHVLANSNSTADQSIKLKVRDRILKESENMLCKMADKQTAISEINRHLPDLTVAANDELKKLGSSDTAEVSFEKTYFETRQYEDVTLPAGEYDALRVKIGSAQGKNWWCVLYTQMCVASASARDKIDEKLDKDEVELVTNGEKYRVKFFVIELFERIKEVF